MLDLCLRVEYSIIILLLLYPLSGQVCLWLVFPPSSPTTTTSTVLIQKINSFALRLHLSMHFLFQMTFTHDCIIMTRKLFLEKDEAKSSPMLLTMREWTLSSIYERTLSSFVAWCWQLIRPYDQVLTHLDDIDSCWKIISASNQFGSYWTNLINEGIRTSSMSITHCIPNDNFRLINVVVVPVNMHALERIVTSDMWCKNNWTREENKFFPAAVRETKLDWTFAREENIVFNHSWINIERDFLLRDENRSFIFIELVYTREIFPSKDNYFSIHNSSVWERKTCSSIT